MSKRIGEVLIDKGLITASQLESALKAQLIYGGHLGTCFIEMGFIDEDSLGQTLSEVSSVPYAPPSVLVGIQESTIRTISRKLAEEFQAVPLKLAGRTLHLAMVNPRDLQAVDAVSFASGYRIVPWVSPEIRIFQALERYYEIPRRLRYIAICSALDRNSRDRARDEAAEAALARAREALAGPGTAPLDEPGAQDPSLPAEIRGEKDLGVEFGYGRSWREIADTLDLGELPPRETSRGDEPRSVPANMPPPSTLEEVADRLCDASDRNEAVGLILEFAATQADRAILLGVHGERAVVWDSRGRSFDRRGRAKAVFDVTLEPLFGLLSGDGFFRGPMPADEQCHGFHEVLGMEPPEEILLAPVHLNDRLVAILYLDGGPVGTICGATEEYLRLLRMFATSLKLVLLKGKLREIAEFQSEPQDERAADPHPSDSPSAAA